MSATSGSRSRGTIGGQPRPRRSDLGDRSFGRGARRAGRRARAGRLPPPSRPGAVRLPTSRRRRAHRGHPPRSLLPAGHDRKAWGFAEMVRRSSDLPSSPWRHGPSWNTGRRRCLRRGRAGRRQRKGPARRGRPHHPAPRHDRGEDVLRPVGASIADSLSPESDVHASGDYRRRLVDRPHAPGPSGTLWREPEADR